MLRRAWRNLVKGGFRLLYNELAWSYDAVSWLVSLGHWRRWQQAAISEIRGSRVLELGHGPGHLLVELQARGYHVVGLDLSHHMGRLARRRGLAAATRPLLVRARAQALPFPARNFDTVLATFPTLYALEAETIADVSRVLRPGGRYVLVPEGHVVGSGLHHRIICWLMAITGQQQGPFELDAAGHWPHPEAGARLRERFAGGGFVLQARRVRFPGSAATVVVASKQSALS